MEPIADDEAQGMRTVLAKFYGPQALTWNITPEMYDLLAVLMLGAQERKLHKGHAFGAAPLGFLQPSQVGVETSAAGSCSAPHITRGPALHHLHGDCRSGHAKQVCTLVGGGVTRV